MKEVDHQANIKLSVKAQGGYALKLSNRFTVGVPDLLIMHPLFVPCIAEVKDLKDCVPDFDRKIDVSPKQDLTMRQMNGVYQSPHVTEITIGRTIRVAFVLVVAKWKLQHIIVPLPQGTERLAASSLVEGVTFWKRIAGRDGGNPSYDIRPLLEAAGVPHVQ